MSSGPDLVLAGFGVRDTLQLTVETQRLLARLGKAYTLGLPPNTRRYLKGRRISLVDLDVHLAPGKPFSDAYIDVAQAVLEAATRERPVVFLAQGNPLFMNAVGRLLAAEGRRLGLEVLVLPGVSPLDVLIDEIGLDVAAYGLQVFDASGLVRYSLPIAPALPAFVLNAAGFQVGRIPGDEAVPDLAPLAAALATWYPPRHVVSLIEPRLEGAGFYFGRTTIEELGGFAARLTPGTCLFLDATSAAVPARAER